MEPYFSPRRARIHQWLYLGNRDCQEANGDDIARDSTRVEYPMVSVSVIVMWRALPRRQRVQDLVPFLGYAQLSPT